MIINGHPKVKCRVCGETLEQDYYTLAGLDKKVCEACDERQQMAVNSMLAGEKFVGTEERPMNLSNERYMSKDLIASIAMSITVTALVSFSAGYYVCSAQAASAVLENLK